MNLVLSKDCLIELQVANKMPFFPPPKNVLLRMIVFFIALVGACANYDSFVVPVVPLPDANYVGSEECAVW